jgi:hypothetical protein
MHLRLDKIVDYRRIMLKSYKTSDCFERNHEKSCALDEWVLGASRKDWKQGNTKIVI